MSVILVIIIGAGQGIRTLYSWVEARRVTVNTCPANEKGPEDEVSEALKFLYS
jgi:hypothetical protein